MVLLSTIRQQQLNAGMRPTLGNPNNPTPLGTNPRSAQINANNQVSIHQANNPGTSGTPFDSNLEPGATKPPQDLANYYAGVDANGNPTGSGNAPMPDHSVAGAEPNFVQGNPAYGPNGKPVASLDDILNNIQKSADNMNANGNNITQSEIDEKKQLAINKFNAEQQQKQTTYQNQLQADQTAGGTTTPSLSTPSSGGSSNTAQQNSSASPPDQSTTQDTSLPSIQGMDTTLQTQNAGFPTGNQSVSDNTNAGITNASDNGGGTDNTGGNNGTGNPNGPNTGGTDNTGNAGITEQANGTLDLSKLSIPPQLEAMINPMLDNLSSRYSSAQDMLTSELDNVQKNMDISNLLYLQGSQQAMLGYQRSLDLTSQMHDAEQSTIDEQKRGDLATLHIQQAQTDAQFHFQANQQRLANIQNERANRIIAAKEGVNVDSGGLDWMQREVQQGQNSLNYLLTQSALSDQEYGNKMVSAINTWGNNMQQLDAQTAQQYGQAYSNYVSTIQTLQKNRLTDMQTQQKNLTQARQDYMNNLTSIDKTKATLMSTYTTALDAQSRIILAHQNHQDIMGLRKDTIYNDMFSKQQSKIERINSSLSSSNPVIKSYQDAQTYISSFDTALTAYDDAVKTGDANAISSAGAQLFVQFSHYQNPGSLRINDLASRDAQGFQSFWSEWSGKLDQTLHGGVGMPPEAVADLGKLVHATMDARKTQVQDIINSTYTSINQWNNAPNISQNYPDLTISPDDIQIPPGFTAPSNYLNTLQTKYKGKITAPDTGTSGSQESSQPMSTNNPTLKSYVSQNGFRITQDFNGTYDESKGYTKGAHDAYDIAPPKPGQKPPVPAYSSGKIIEVGSTGPYGNHFKVQAPDGIVWLYGHLDSLNVKQGQNVTQGQIVGIMGDTGQADGVHLHLEAYKNGKPFDFGSTQIAFNQ